MQLMPGTAGDMNVTDPYNPANNLEGGIKYLSQQLSRFQNTEQALAAYNAGPQSLLRYRGQIPPYNETRQYIQRVMHYKNRYQNDWQQHIK
jgi:lytic transglycosylase